jgi:broad specificity phosphatase PhoE
MLNPLHRMRFAALTALMALWSFPLAGQSVILVRHAERAGGMSGDVPISEAGRCRAEALAKMLADTGITHIYTSEVVRTQQTAAPLAKKLGITPEVIPAKDVDALVEKLRAGGKQGVALVVGHSNTLPEIVARLGGGAVPPIADNEYGRMMIVTVTGPKQATVVTLHYAGCAP